MRSQGRRSQSAGPHHGRYPLDGTSKQAEVGLSPSAIHDLLLYLKLQLLGLPGLARWGAVMFAGVIVGREAVTAAWNANERRKALGAAHAGPEPAAAVPGTEDPQALPAPNPLAARMGSAPEASAATAPARSSSATR